MSKLIVPAARRAKDEDADVESPFAGLQKNVVLREARLFNQPQLNPQKCIKVLTKLLYLLNQGEVFTKEETTDVFFSVTKLFQSQDVHLRRMTYLMIKELRIPPDESLIVVSCLSKDMTSKVDLFRANSIRVLAKLLDPSMVTQVERFLKQSIVDSNPFIVSSTLVAGQHLFNTAPDVVKRWANEIQSAMTNRSKIVQYHALALLYKIKQHDRQAISKVMNNLARNSPKSAMAQTLQIRVIAQTLEQSPTPDPDLLKYLNECLHSKNFMVSYEAARTICRYKNVTPAQLNPAIQVLQEFLSSPVPTQKFAAVRTLSEVVQKHPSAVSSASVDLEHLITDSNRNIATLAITTLLKTASEASVDRLMKSITGFMTDITDDFKMFLVEAVKTLALKFPHKHQTLLNFLSTSLREEGGFAFKQALVDAMLEIIEEIPDSKETGLEQFCEFIEDCEFPELTIKILHILGEKGSKTSRPAVYIRFIFNRIILETAAVRAAAVTALARFGTAVPALSENILVLLKRSLYDSNDEVRDRAIFYYNTLKSHNPKQAKALLFPKTEFNLDALEQSLNIYLLKPQTEPFDIKKHLIEEKLKPTEGEKKDDQKGGGTISPVAVTDTKKSELLSTIPELAELGPIWKSCEPVELTESEAEYVVNCIKHITPTHVIFQFNVTSKMADQVLEKVSVEMECEKDWATELTIPEPELKFGVPGVTFVALQRPSDAFSSGSLTCTLNFIAKDVDSSGEVDGAGVEDQYQLEEMEVKEGDFMRKGDDIGLIEFKRQWDTLGDGVESVKKYSLGLDSLQAAVDAVVELLGMTPCEKSGVVPEGARTHTVNLSGTYFGDVPILTRAAFLLDPKPAVTLKIAVRSKETSISQLLVNAIR